ncbi:FtsP/CotA-like multicopper oxidase with cupredoxin domain [Streptomyces luteogriseus]|nr:FtsP/CotA-like multicopper oxidase with cupredoxin domain [Streptomyces luteogriseus]
MTGVMECMTDDRGGLQSLGHSAPEAHARDRNSLRNSPTVKENLVFSRRHAIRLGLTTGAVGAVGAAGGVFRTLTAGQPAADAGAAAGKAAPAGAAAAPVEPFSLPLTTPPVLAPYRRTKTADHYRITMRRAGVEILPGTRTDALTYNGSFTGPTIRARTGRTTVVQQVNALDMPTSVHLHGGNNPVAHDGGMMDTIAPGRKRTYVYENKQPGATLWTHDHAHHMESEHVYRGLSGLYLLRDPAEDRLGLPAGKYDIPLVLRDAHFDGNAQLVYTMDDAENRTTILVNGRPWPYLEVEARKYRFRLVNSCNLRIFVLALSDGSATQHPVQQIGTDGGLLAAPAETPVLVLSPGERIDFVVDFSKYAPGTRLTLANMLGPGPTELVGQVMRFDIGERTADASRVPDTLTHAAGPARADRGAQLRALHGRARLRRPPGLHQRQDLRPGPHRHPHRVGQHRGVDGHQQERHRPAQLPYAPGAVPHSRAGRAAAVSGGDRLEGHRAALPRPDGETPAHLRFAPRCLSVPLPHDRPQRHGNDGADEDRLILGNVLPESVSSRKRFAIPENVS